MIVWQTYLAITAFRGGRALESLLHGLGAQVGPGVSMFLAASRWWIVVALIFTVLAFVAMQRLESKPTFAMIVFAAAIVVSLLLNICWREAWFGPIFTLIRQVG